MPTSHWHRFGRHCYAKAMETRTKRLLVGLSIGLFATSAAFAQAYKWVDKDGVVHYSDRPIDGAEEIQLPESNTVRTRRIAPRTPSPAEPEEDSNATAVYQSLEIRSPAAEETLWNIEAILNVSLNLSPALKPGHQVRVYFDGKPQLVSGTNFRLEQVYRGAHNLQAEVIDETGQLLIRCQPSRFYVQQNSVL